MGGAWGGRHSRGSGQEPDFRPGSKLPSLRVAPLGSPETRLCPAQLNSSGCSLNKKLEGEAYIEVLACNKGTQPVEGTGGGGGDTWVPVTRSNFASSTSEQKQKQTN